MDVPVANRMGVIRGWPFHCAEVIDQSVYATVTARSVHDTVQYEVQLTSKTAARFRT